MNTSVCPSDMTVERWSLDTSLPQLSAGEIVESLTRWEGMEDTIVLFQDMIRMEKGTYYICQCTIHINDH